MIRGKVRGTVRELACRMYVIVLDKSVSSTVMTLHTKKMAALPSAKMGMSSYNSKKCSAASCWFTKNSRNLIRSHSKVRSEGGSVAVSFEVGELVTIGTSAAHVACVSELNLKVQVQYMGLINCTALVLDADHHCAESLDTGLTRAHTATQLYSYGYKKEFNKLSVGMPERGRSCTHPLEETKCGCGVGQLPSP
jgi:hypothetical protein